MSSIDERIVAMKFNNGQFENGVKQTVSSLDKLKQGLNLEGAAKGLGHLADVGKNFSLAGIANGVDSLMSKFSALGILGVAALANITNKAVNAGLSVARSLTVAPIMDGFREYELKMGSIQTILANTARHGTTLDDVSVALDDLNEYADKTIYNFGAMTKNIGLFTNAGIRVEDATSMIKGFSNAAAASGTTAEGAAGAAYQLSQALSSGTVRLMDWKSLTNAGMGNKNMQDGLVEIAGAMGTLEANSISAEEVQGNFNASLEKNWLSADVMSTYLRIMAGDMDDASMAALGLSDAQIAAFKESQKTAEDAATKVRTFTQLMDTMKEAVGSGWAETFNLLIGDFESATDLWTNVNDTLGKMVGRQADARNELIKGFVDGGGRDAAIEALGNGFKALMNIITPIKSAFKEIFPPATAAQLISLVENVRDFTKSLIPSGETMALIKRTAMGLFAVLDIGWMIIKQVAGVIGDLFGNVAGASGGFLEVTANIGDFLVKVRDAIKDGDGLAKTFGVIRTVLQWVFDAFGAVGSAIVSWVDVGSLAEAWQKLANGVKMVYEFIKPAIDWVVNGLKDIGGALKDAFTDMDPSLLVGAMNTGLLAGLGGVLVAAIQIIKKGFKIDLTGGLLETIKGAFGSLTDTMTAMQNKIKADILIKIATAIAILTASLVVLSFIDTDKLAISLGAITIMLGQLMGALEVFTKISNGTEVAKMMGLSVALILLATAMVIFASAIKIMSSMDWNELARGLVGMAVGITILVIAADKLSQQTGKMAAAAFGLTLMSAALLIMATAFKVFATMSWEELAKGAATVTILLAVLSRFADSMKNITGLAVGALGILLISGAMLVLAKAMKSFAEMSIEDIAKGLMAMVGALLAIKVSMEGLGPKTLASAAALLVVSAALHLIAGAFAKMAGMSWDEIGRGMVVLGGSLAILAAAMALMGIPLVLLGAVGLTAAAIAMTLLAPAMVMLGSMSWDQIGAGLAVLASALGILAGGGILMIAALPGLLGLGVAIMLIGAGTLMAGAGLAAFALGLGTLAVAGPLAAGALKMALLTLISIIPLAMTALAQGIIQFALVIAEGGVQITAALVTVLTSLITAIATVAPLIIQTLWDLVMMMVDTLVQNVPVLVDSGLQLLTGILDGIASNIGGIIESATNVVVNFIDGIAASLPQIIESGVNLIISFIDGIANAIRDNSARMEEAGQNLADAIVDGMVGGITSGIDSVVNAAKGIAEGALNAAKNFLGIKSPSREFFKLGAFSTQGMANGLDKTGHNVSKAAEGVGYSAVSAMKKSMAGMATAMATDVDMQPTIRPVLDLSNIKKGATQLDGMLAPPSMRLSRANNSAASIAAEYVASQTAGTADSETAVAPVNQVSFVQNNHSPKALSTVEIYRNTRNQIATMRGALLG